MSDFPASASQAPKEDPKPVVDDPKVVRDLSDPGDATVQNFRYQHAFGVMLMVAAKRGVRPYVAIWCEHHEDLLAERQDEVFDAYQIKTSRPERGAWRLTDGELTKSIGRFIDLVAEFGERIGELHFVSNTEFEEVTPGSKDDKKRSRCPRLFLQHIRGCTNRSEVKAPFDGAFDELQATCGCEPEELLAVLHRMNLIQGPSRREFDAALAHEHLAQLGECRALTADQLDAFRDDLVAIVYRASSLHVTDPIRHLRPMIEAEEMDPVLAAKRVAIDEALVYRSPSTAAPTFRFPGRPTLELGARTSHSVLDQKFTAAGLEDDLDYMRERVRAAEFNLLEDVARRPEAFPDLLLQIEQRVHGELAEAHLRARQKPAPYGPSMLIDAQDRLRRIAHDQSDDVGHHSYDCLVGVAGLLTSECRVWWGPRFPIDGEAV